MAILKPEGANKAVAATKQSKVTNASQSEKYAAIVNFFRAKGLSAQGAAGIAGNLMQESSLNPEAAGGGLAQDIGGRGAGEGASAYAQLEAIWSELQADPKTLEGLHKSSTAAAAARIFSEEFERPGIPDLSNREHYAEEALASVGQGGGAFTLPGQETWEKFIGGILPGGSGSVNHPSTDTEATRAVSSDEALKVIGEWFSEPTRILKLVGGAALLYLGVKTLTAGSPAEGAVQAPAKAVKAAAGVVPADRAVKLAKQGKKASKMKPMMKSKPKPRQALQIAKGHGK